MAGEKDKGKGKPKEEAPSDDGHSMTWKFLGLVVLISAIFGLIETQNASQGVPLLGSDPVTGKSLSFSTIIPSGDLEKGMKIINKNDAPVREEAGGQILDIQDKGEKGKIVNGPIRAAGGTWRKVNYNKAPDGWVEDYRITNHTGWYLFLNFLPISISWLRPVVAILSLIFIVLLFLVMKKRGEVINAMNKKKILGKETDENISTKKTASEIIAEENKLPIILEEEDLSEPTIGIKNERWMDVKRLMNSYEMSDWKQALHEADALLEDMLARMSYDGATVEERLNQIEPSDFLTLNEAKEANRLKIMVFHRGDDYPVSQDEVKRIIGLYEQVFREFYFI